MAYPHIGGSVPLHTERAQQVDALLRSYPVCKAINADRTVFDLPLELRDKTATALRISLPSHFPTERPVLSVLLPVVHPAVDGTGRLHTPALTSWVYGHSQLVGVVAEAVASLTTGATTTSQTTQPPQQHTEAALRRDRRTGVQPSSPGVTKMANGYGPSTASGTGSSAANSAKLPDLTHMSTEELEGLMNDEAAFKALVKGMVEASPMVATLEDIRIKNRQLAEANMSRQGAINEVRNQLAVVKSSEYTAIKARYDELHARQATVLTALGGGAFKQALEHAVSEADAASAALASSFAADDITIAGFVGQFVDARIKYHTLDLKRQAAEHILL